MACGDRIFAGDKLMRFLQQRVREGKVDNLCGGATCLNHPSLPCKGFNCQCLRTCWLGRIYYWCSWAILRVILLENNAPHQCNFSNKIILPCRALHQFLFSLISCYPYFARFPRLSLPTSNIEAATYPLPRYLLYGVTKRPEYRYKPVLG